MADYSAFIPSVNSIDYPTKIANHINATEAVATEIELGSGIFGTLDLRFDDSEGRLDINESAISVLEGNRLRNDQDQTTVGNFTISKAAPQFIIDETDAILNERQWRVTSLS